MVAVPPGAESLFRAYLRQRGLSADYEVPDRGRNPDFLVHHPLGDVVCEVFEPALRLGSGGAIDPYEHLRRTFGRRKRSQGAGAKERGAPYVLVLGRANSDLSFDAISVTGAMFGNHGVSMPFDPVRGAADKSRAEWGFLLGGGLHAKKNTRYSAIAVLTSFNPTLHRVQRAFQDVIQRRRIPAGQRALVINEAFERARATGEFDDAAAVARLTMYHNPYAANPLPAEVFGGPHDQQWGALAGPGGEIGYTMIAEGRRAKELPRPSLD